MNWCYIGNVHLKEVLLLEIWWLLMANIMSLVLTVEALNLFLFNEEKDLESWISVCFFLQNQFVHGENCWIIQIILVFLDSLMMVWFVVHGEIDVISPISFLDKFLFKSITYLEPESFKLELLF